jgi:hypothetical protein
MGLFNKSKKSSDKDKGDGASKADAAAAAAAERSQSSMNGRLQKDVLDEKIGALGRDTPTNGLHNPIAAPVDKARGLTSSPAHGGLGGARIADLGAVDVPVSMALLFCLALTRCRCAMAWRPRRPRATAQT